MSFLRLDNRTALVTGGGSGIGQQIAFRFAQQGALVHLLDLNERSTRETVRKIQEAGGKAKAHVCNLSHQDEVVDVMNAIQTESPINILVNNAGVAHIGIASETSEEDFELIFRNNVKSVYNCLYACLPHMQKNGGGVILNMASVAALVGIPERFAYSMSKGAVISMTLSVAKDYIEDHIRCNSISPARIHTPFVDNFLTQNYPGREKEMYNRLAASQPIGRMGTPEEVANLALYLCSDEAGFITGTDFPIDGGFVKINN